MLLHRSILSKVCLLLAICLVNAKYGYEKEEQKDKKDVKKDEDDDRDYAKIFAQETSAALTAAVDDDDDDNSPKPSDYVTPVEFENYFTPAHIFGESNDKTVKASPEKKKKKKESLEPYESKKKAYSAYFDDATLKKKKKKEPLEPYESKKEDYSAYFDDVPLKKKKKKEPLETRESKKDDYPAYLDDGPLKDFFDDSEKRQQKLHKEQSSKDEEVIPPGPSYISHQIPAHYGYEDDEDDEKATSASEDVERKKNKEKNNSYQIPAHFGYEDDEKATSASEDVERKKNKEKNDYYQIPAHFGYEEDEDDEKTTSASEDVQRKRNKEKTIVGEDFAEGRVEKEDGDYKLPPYTFEPLKNNKPNVDYNTGKSSSTVSQYPAASGYEKPAASTPYQKYSFQPAEDYKAENSKFFDAIISTVTPYNPTYKKNAEPKYETQSTKDAPSQTQAAKGCRKITSSSSSDDMNCFICENPKTNAKYTQCSYTSQKKPIDFYEGNTAQYSHKEQPNSYRYKRYAENEENDPYTYVRNRAMKGSSGRGPRDYGAEFQYEAEHYDESKPELTFSEKHSENIKKNPDNCQKIEKDGMTCTVCKDPKTGGNFEQCSYTSKPKEKKYAYVTEKKFDNDEPVETQVVSQAKEAEIKEKQVGNGPSKTNAEYLEQYQSRINQEKAPKQNKEESHKDHDAKPSEKKAVDDDGYKFTNYFGPSYSDLYKGSSSDRAENVDNRKKSEEDFTDFDEYHFKYFPEFAKQESKQEPVKEKYVVPVPEATKENVESVLAEFSKKDRSNCKKAEKKGMTCFLCVDKNNIQNEECMYVQQSKPETKHVAYHEVKATEKAKAAEPEKITEQPKQEVKQDTKQESKQEPITSEGTNKYFFKNVPKPAPLLGLEAAASEQVASVVKFEPEEDNKKVKRSNKDNKKERKYDSESDSDSKKEKKKSDKGKEPKSDASTYESERLDDKADPTIKTPEEFDVPPGEGAFSDETKAVYSKELGVQLPKYMLDKSEFEKEFDAFAGSF